LARWAIGVVVVVLGHLLVTVWLFQSYLNHLQCEQGRFCCSEHDLENLVPGFVLDHETVAVEMWAYEAAPVSLVGQVVAAVAVVQWRYPCPLEEGLEG
jgi:hypothetical protein